MKHIFTLAALCLVFSLNAQQLTVGFSDCTCNNDALENTTTGTFNTYIKVSNPSSGTDPFKIVAASGITSTLGASLVGSILQECNNCGITGINNGDYYIHVTVLSSNNFSITIEDDSATPKTGNLSNQSCTPYPTLPSFPASLNTINCITEVTRYTMPTGTTLAPEGTTNNTFARGFRLDANDLLVNPDSIYNDENPFKFSLTYEDSSMCRVTAKDSFEFIHGPVATLKDVTRECIKAGTMLNLLALFTDETTSGGIFTVNGTSLNKVDSVLYQVNTPGCYTIEYDVNVAKCSPASDTKNLYVTFAPDPKFSIVEQNLSPLCRYGTQDTTINIVLESNGANPSFDVFPTPANIVSTSNGYAVTLDAPGEKEDVAYKICYSEGTNTTTFTGCGTITGPTNMCRDTVCKKFIVYNDGYDCGANALFESQCYEPYKPEPCEAEANPTLELSCSFFNIPLPIDFFTSEVEFDPNVYNCQDDSIRGSYNVSLLGIKTSSIDGGTKIGDFPGVGVICDVLNFKIFGWRPLGALYNAIGCDKTIIQFIFDIISKALGGDGGGVLIVADTDGDGSFDYQIEEGAFPADDDFSIPNRVNNSGYVTVRAIGGFPNKPVSECGELVPEGPNLLDLLPIGSIPLVGPQIEDALAAAQCNVNLGFSSETTEQIVILNTGAPVFINCNPSGYVFTNSLNCENAINWSIPVAVEGCSDNILSYKGIVNNSTIDVSKYLGNVTPIYVDIDSPGIYQTAGPIPGSILDPGTYEITYTAVGCNGNPSTCTFPVVVQAGYPTLVCPANVITPTDVDSCIATVFGITPLQGLGCSTIINYSYTTPVTSNTVSSDSMLAGQHAFPEGHKFEIGTTTVTYTMEVDINGDGDYNDTINDVLETQSCSFTVTVEDKQRPSPVCLDVDLMLDASGSGIIYAEQNGSNIFIDGGSVDNCGIDTITISRLNGTFKDTLMFNCSEIGQNYVKLRVEDTNGNVSTCTAIVNVKNFFEDYKLELDAPEIWLEGANPEQLNFSNYLNITAPNGDKISPSDISTLIGGDVVGAFGISAFIPSQGNTNNTIGTNANNPGGIGYINPNTGQYTPGTGTGFVTISYLLGIRDQFREGGSGLAGCFNIVHTSFELKPPLTMGSPECQCLEVDSRAVDLGIVSGGLEPYRLEYTGGTLDFNEDGTPDDVDGLYIFDAASGNDIDDVMQDLGQLILNYTQPVWSITVVDARGCEVFRSGSCDNADLTSGPVIDCMGVNDFDSEFRICERQYSWQHAIPYDNCAVTQYSFTITNPDGTISGPHSLDALIDDANNGVPLDILRTATYDFEEGLSVVTYYAEDAVGNYTECSFNITVGDNDPPVFINCPMPDIVVNTETQECDAYVNFSIPIAEDNCGNVLTTTQIDDTGLSSGSRFPIGTTILTFKAKDTKGNTSKCKVKVIVNDYTNEPTITCPSNSEKENDPWKCTAVVDNISANASNLCSEGLIVTWKVENDSILIGSGLDDASGFEFSEGVSTVTYRVQNQPLLLISEVSQDADHLLGGMNPTPIATDFQCLSNLVSELGNGDAGEGLAFYPVDNRFYHTSGSTDNNEFLEEIFLNPYFCIQPNRVNDSIYGPDAAGEITGIVYHDTLEKFILMDENGDIFESSTTGVFTKLGNYSSTALRGFAYINDNIYGVDPTANTLVQFLTDGTIVSTQTLNKTGVQGITYNPLNSITYIIYNNGGPHSILGTVDISTGVITEVGNTNLDLATIAFDENGILYGVSSDNASPASSLYRIYCQVPGDDYIEITNFGKSAYDISCLVIDRKLPNGDIESFTVPANTILSPQNVLVLHYGPGSDEVSGPNYLYNLPLGTDQNADTEITYSIYYIDNNIDEIQMFADANSGIIRKSIFDTDTKDDFTTANDCYGLSLGIYNPTYPTISSNGDTTSLQSIPKKISECTFTVTIKDSEAPMCMELGEQSFKYTAQGFNAVGGECNEYKIRVPEADSCIIGDLNVNIKGEITNSDYITITLTDPNNNSLVLYDAGCNSSSNNVDITFDDEASNPYTSICASWNDTVRSQNGMLMEFFSSKPAGEWTLNVLIEDGHNASFNVTEWSISGSCLIPWDMADVTIDNDLDKCGAEFTWIHPYFVDNCKGGQIRVDYSSDDDPAINVPQGGVLTDNFGKGGYEVTEFFEVGTTHVIYTLTDNAGNQHQCEFNVAVRDTQNPVFTVCPSDIFVQLNGGECRTPLSFQYDAEDNCSIDSIVSIPPSGSLFEIDTTEVIIIAYDPSGNTDTCKFNVIVAEYVPKTNKLNCINEINLSLDNNCTAEITADMLLSGKEYRCFENYCIYVEDASGKEHPNYFDLTDVGMQFSVSIIDCMNPDKNNINSCWGYVNIEEKLIPEIKCPAPFYLGCNQNPKAVDDDGNLLTGEVEVLTCEPLSEIRYYDEIIDYDNCDSIRRKINRLWRVDDGEGNYAECTQEIFIKKFSVDDIEFPKDILVQDAIDCYDLQLNDSLSHPSHTGYPTLNGVNILNTGSLCMISRKYGDEIFDICEGSYEILRTWKVRDMCEPLSINNPRVHTQIIKVLDQTKPKFAPCPQDIVVSTGAWNCLANAYLSLPEQIYDYCSTMNFTAQIYGGGIIDITGSISTNDLKVYAKNMQVGDHKVVYRVEDQCGNFSQCEFTVTVIDKSAPVATAKNNIVIGLTSGGYAKVHAEKLDNGSYDGCSPTVKLEVRRKVETECNHDSTNGYNSNNTFNNDGHLSDNPNDTDNGEYVTFCCQDLDTIYGDGNGDGEINDLDKGYIAVELRVWDDGDNNGIFGSEGDNFSETWGWVKVENKLLPILTCPEDVDITCDWAIDTVSTDWVTVTSDMSFTKVGAAIAESVCGYEKVQFKDELDLNRCGVGTIKRTWRVKNSNIQCEQTINVLHQENELRITHPEEDHFVHNQCLFDISTIPSNMKPSIISQGSCDVIGENASIDTFYFANGHCKKWVVTYKYWNWCTNTQVNIEDANIDGTWTATYFYDDMSKPIFTNCEDREFFVDENCEWSGSIMQTAVDTGGCNSSSLKWQFFMDEWADGSINKYASSFIDAPSEGWLTIDQNHELWKHLPLGNNWADNVMIRRVINNSNELEINDLGQYKGNMSTHKVIWKVTDGCHNESVCSHNIKIIDKKAPTPYCINTSSAVMDNDDKSVELRAIDFDKDSYDNCTYKTKLRYTFSDILPENDPNYIPEDRSSYKVFDCNDIGQNTVKVYVWDENNNYDYCSVQLKLRGTNCSTIENSLSIGGSIKSSRGNPVKSVNVELDAVLEKYPIRTTTNSLGEYLFTNTPSNTSYEISAAKEGDILANGEVNTLDIIMIQLHILEKRFLTSKYDLIASDINNDGKVSSQDLLPLRKAILRLSSEFPNNKSWKILTENDTEIIEKKALTTNSTQNNFIAIKIGDTDGSMEESGKRQQSVELFTAKDQKVRAGEMININLTTSAKDIYGFQLNFDLDGLIFKDISSENLSLDSNNVANHNNSVIISYSETDAINENDLFNLKLIATKDGELSDMISIGDIINPEIYTGNNLKKSIIQLKIGELPLNNKYQLLQNEPNPFKSTTKIGFVLPKSDKATLSIIDITGKLILKKDIDANAGYNEVKINNLNVTGVLYYKLESEDFTETKKMIVID